MDLRGFDNSIAFEAASPSPSGPHSWSNALIPIFAFTRLIKSLIPKPASKSNSLSNTFPTFAPGELRYIVSFGDSNTATGFGPLGVQPHPGNPLGNPPYPGQTSANGPNWIDYLTVQFNQSYVETINFAGGGARVDAEVIGPSDSGGIKYQFEGWFKPVYGSRPPFFPWTDNSTLFTIFVGINDIAASWNLTDRDSLYDRTFQSYSAILDTFYSTGARNLLLLNVPPIQRMPGAEQLYIQAGSASVRRELLPQAVEDWNTRLLTVASNLSSAYPDVRIGVTDTHSLFDSALAYPCSSQFTCPIRETTTFCRSNDTGRDVKSNGYGRPKDPGCKFYDDQYFWRDGYHFMWRVHEMLADSIARSIWKLDDS